MTAYFEIGAEALLDGAVVTVIGWAGASNFRPKALGHSCPDGDMCSRYEVSGPVPTAWGCHLRPRIDEGGVMDCRAGGQVVRVHCTRRDHAYHVQLGAHWVAAPGEPPFETVASFGDEGAARRAARELVVGLREVERLTTHSDASAVPAAAQTPTAPAPARRVVARPVPTGGHGEMSPVQAAAIRYALDHPNQDGERGVLGRGRREGCLDSRQLAALGRRGFAEPIHRWTGRRRELVGARVTPWGARRAGEVLAVAVA